jgi:hypothetical protein
MLDFLPQYAHADLVQIALQSDTPDKQICAGRKPRASVRHGTVRHDTTYVVNGCISRMQPPSEVKLSGPYSGRCVKRMSTTGTTQEHVTAAVFKRARRKVGGIKLVVVDTALLSSNHHGQVQSSCCHRHLRFLCQASITLFLTYT